MSTPLLNKEHGKGFYFTEFHAGTIHGRCYQITGGEQGVLESGDGFVQLSTEQMEALLFAYLIRRAALDNPHEPGEVLLPILTRAEFVEELLAVWDATLGLEPSLQGEHAIATEWLTKAWTVRELAGELHPPDGGPSVINLRRPPGQS